MVTCPPRVAYESDDMNAALKTAEGDFEIKDVERPKIPDPNWALARVRVSGICGTDLRHWKKALPKLKGTIMGHELAGDVVEVGENVKHVKPGDRVVIETLLGCGQCEWCRVQRYNVCPKLYEVRVKSVSRAFAEFVVGPAEKFHKLPDGVSFEEATLLDTFGVCMHGIQVSGIKINDTVAIIGAGPIGLGQVQLAKLSGARRIIVTDAVQHSLDVAKELGADAVVNIKKQDPVKAVQEFTGGRGADIVYECAGGESMPTTFPQATQMARIGGKVVLIGGFDEGPMKIELDWQHIQKAEIQILPSASYSFWGLESEMKMCLDLMAAGKLKAKPLITHRFPLAEINKAFETAADKEKTGAIFVALES